MKHNSKHHRVDLKAIARRVMIDRGLLRDFSSAVMVEVREIEGAVAEGDHRVRDLRGLLWASFDQAEGRKPAKHVSISG